MTERPVCLETRINVGETLAWVLFFMVIVCLGIGVLWMYATPVTVSYEVEGEGQSEFRSLNLTNVRFSMSMTAPYVMFIGKDMATVGPSGGMFK